jgi:glycosyltransferase involved in cell wall biosynthesis
MRVLLVNHTGLKSGAEATTLGLLTHLPDEITAVVACPAGPLADEARRAGVAVEHVAGTTGSLRLDPAQTPRALWDILRFAYEIRASARRVGADVVHATSVRAGLAAAVPLGPRTPLVVSVHDCLPTGAASAVVRRIVDAGAAGIVANSRYTARAWRTARDGAPLRVVHPGINAAPFGAVGGQLAARAALGLDPSTPLVGVIAQITPWKGQHTAVRALASARRLVPKAELVLAGETKFMARATRYDNRAYFDALTREIVDLGLQDAVRFLGQRDDVARVMTALDVVLIPSTEEPFGLVMLEAMAAGTPVVATDIGGPAEVIVDGENGRLVPPGHPERWAQVIAELLRDPATCHRLVGAGCQTVRRFSLDAYAKALVEAYVDVARVAATFVR